MKRLVLLFLVLAAICTLAIGCGGAASQVAAGSDVIQMATPSFSPSRISIQKGGRITFVDDSNQQALHILILGDRLQPQNEPGAPDFGGWAGIRIDTGGSWTSPPWNTAGVFHVACSIHPLMNLTVIVT